MIRASQAQHLTALDRTIPSYETGSKFAKVDFSKPHAPLLFVSGSTDHIMPASLQRAAVAKYKKGNDASLTEYMEFADRNHFVLGLPTWKEEADFILNWLSTH